MQASKPDELDELVHLDPHNLDLEWVRQPRKVMRYALRLANAERKYAEARANYDVVCADVSLDARRNPMKYKLLKPTDEAVKSVIPLDKRCQEALREVILSKHLVDRYKGVMQALEHLKKALENMVVLHGRDYFAAPRAKDADAGRTVDELNQRRVNSRTRGALDRDGD
jgi:hypothetical protein